MKRTKLLFSTLFCVLLLLIAMPSAFASVGDTIAASEFDLTMHADGTEYDVTDLFYFEQD